VTATPISVQGQFSASPDRVPAGQISFKLTDTLINGATMYPATPISGTLDALGRLVDPSGYPLIVPANDDSASLPAGTAYTVTARISGQQVSEFTVVVSATATATDTVTLTSGSQTVVLGALIPSSAMIGQAITGTGIPASTTVTGVSLSAGTVTISNPATANGPTAATIAGVVTFATLQEESQ
jgi:hypothetical protein